MSQNGGQKADQDWRQRANAFAAKRFTHIQITLASLWLTVILSDPDGWSVTIAHYALVNRANIEQMIIVAWGKNISSGSR